MLASRQFAIILMFLALVGLSLIPDCSAETAFDRGLRFFNQRDYKTAGDIFAQEARTNKLSPNPMYYAALCRQYLGNSAEAKQYYLAIIKQFPASQAAMLSKRALATLGAASAVPGQSTSSSQAGPASTSGQAASTSGQALPSSADSKDELLENEVRFRGLEQMQIKIPVTVNGVRKNFLFDTMVENLLIGKNHLKDFELKQPLGKAPAKNESITGTYSVWRIPVEIEVGKLKKQVMLDVKDGDLKEPVIGYGFFQGWQLDLDDFTSTLHMRKGRARKAVPPNLVKIPLSRSGKRLALSAKVNNIDCHMLLDLGSRACLFYGADVNRYGVRFAEGSHVVSLEPEGGDRLEARPARVKSLQVGEISEEDVPAYVVARGQGIPMLGMIFFKNRRIMLDMASYTLSVSK